MAMQRAWLKQQLQLIEFTEAEKHVLNAQPSIIKTVYEVPLIKTVQEMSLLSSEDGLQSFELESKEEKLKKSQTSVRLPRNLRFSG